MGEQRVSRVHYGQSIPTNGYDALEAARALPHDRSEESFTFDYNAAYGRYFRIQKVLVGSSGSSELIDIANELADTNHPDYLNVAGWSYLEAALSGAEDCAIERIECVEKAESAWKQTLSILETNPIFAPETGNADYADTHRIALSLAYTPLVRALIAGNITEAVQERVFADTLAIAERCVIDQHLAMQLEDDVKRSDALSDYTGFLHECNCLLALLYRNDPQRIPMPSSARAGSGLEYASETHDIMVIHQKWGTIHRTTPIEVKSHCGTREYDRYKALVVRGKAHLLPQNFGHHHPSLLVEAFSDAYNSHQPAMRSLDACDAAARVVERLLVDYQKSQRIDEGRERNTRTHFHVSPHLGRYATRADLLSA